MSILKRWLPVMAWSAVILLASGEQFSADNTSGWFRALFGTDAPRLLNFLIRRATHLISYAILGVLAFRAGTPASSPAGQAASSPPLIALAVALFVAITDETLQSMTFTRSGSPWDVLLDMIGAALAISFVSGARARKMSER